MKVLTSREARKIIAQLNRMDLDRANYEYIQELIGKLIVGIPMRGITPHKESRIYRGIVYKEKPSTTDQLGYPPAEIVANFQRCNPPAKPMFYCSPDPASVFCELDVTVGDSVYLSKWSIINNFFINQIAPITEDGIDHPVKDIVFTFFETNFSKPIHETYSSQYKITSAIADKLSFGNIDGNWGKIGAITYPSVSHPGRSENLAIRPEIVDSCLKLDYIEELHVTAVEGTKISYNRTDFSASFDGKNIKWEGKILHWTVPPGGSVVATAERDGWVLRDEQGNIVNPG